MEKAASVRADRERYHLRRLGVPIGGKQIMSTIAKMVAAFLLFALVLAAAGLADVALNDGRILYGLIGRNAIVEACLPELKRGLAERGFAPADLELDPHPDIAVAFGAPKTLGAGFHVPGRAGADPNRRNHGLRGRYAANVHIEFRTNARPVRAG